MNQSKDYAIDRRSALAIAGAGVGIGATMLPLSQMAQAAAPDDTRIGLGRDQSFDLGWRFAREAAEGLEAPGIDDSGWRKVDLPHDFSIEDVPGGQAPRQLGPFDKTSQGGTATGFTVGGEGWYRKHFRLSALPADARIDILFDGVAVTSDVWLNGKPLGSHVHAYTPFAFDLTPHLDRDGDNVLAVRVRNLGHNSRWYAGSGLYRQVRLDVTAGPARLARWGVGAWTRRIADGRAEVDVTTNLEGSTEGLTLVTRLRTQDGRVVAEASGAAVNGIKQLLAVASPALWSPAAPTLHSLETELRQGKRVIDRIVQPFGIRIVTMDAANGLRINGVGMKLRGGCIHHDNGLLGARALYDADERRVLRLKARGYNAIRSSHNPASTTLRTACDRHGILLIEESFDMWQVPKEKDDYSNVIRQDWQAALAAMVLSARNSPSVIMWSIGNEIPYRSQPEGMEWCWKFANEVRRIDPTRPVTAALNGVLGAPVMPSDKAARVGFAGKADEASTVFLDVAGYNYRLEDIEADHARHPDRVIYASETFPKDAYDYQALGERALYMLGEFVWTAMDYLGEAGIGASLQIPEKTPFYLAQFPWVNAWCGDIDLIGDQKPPSLARDVIWGLSPLEMMVEPPVEDGKKTFVAAWGWANELPSWNWPEGNAKPLTVRLYTSGDRVELRLNGRSLGEKQLSPADKMRVEFSVPFAPGTLEAVAWRAGKEIGRRRLETVSAPARLRLTPEKAQAGATRQSLAYVGVDILDAQGRRVIDGTTKISLTIAGPAELVGFGSANPMAVGSFQSKDAESFRGRALAILRGSGRSGRVRIEARAEGLAAATATLRLG
jgi:beta-galactosidase